MIFSFEPRNGNRNRVLIIFTRHVCRGPRISPPVDIAVNWGANDKMHFQLLLSLSRSLSIFGVFYRQVVYRTESESESGRLAVSIKLINNFMLLKQTAVPKREEHNKFFCVWNALFLVGVIRLATKHPKSEQRPSLTVSHSPFFMASFFAAGKIEPHNYKVQQVAHQK